MTALKKESDQLIKDVLALKEKCHNQSEVKEEHIAVSFWLPKSYKKKFEQLQDVTNKEFGKTLKSAFIRAIDAAIE